MTSYEFNKLSKEDIKRNFASCCASSRWVELMLEKIPFPDVQALLSHGQSSWYDACRADDWLEAFAGHPRIGDKKNTNERVRNSLHLAMGEQSGVEEKDAELLSRLHDANKAYENKFGFTFIVCASGKSGEEMLQLLQDRLKNTVREEISIAMNEQWKITLIRLENFFNDFSFPKRESNITTHVLDTSAGKPARGIAVSLLQLVNHEWEKVASGRTNADGRLSDLLPPGLHMQKINYKLLFDTAGYFSERNETSFYPEVHIIFNIIDKGHYHVPLLLSPFGYTTYRGS